MDLTTILNAMGLSMKSILPHLRPDLALGQVWTRFRRIKLEGEIRCPIKGCLAMCSISKSLEAHFLTRTYSFCYSLNGLTHILLDIIISIKCRCRTHFTRASNYLSNNHFCDKEVEIIDSLKPKLSSILAYAAVYSYDSFVKQQKYQDSSISAERTSVLWIKSVSNFKYLTFPNLPTPQGPEQLRSLLPSKM
jgi:hypothetical protein